ncbi:pyruvate kinase [Dyadobacter sp. BE34]|uniref:Pyruvate kinase n=1 Tax=Dyadobacter fermentans TaxID=94254 RepID=A0ABU1R2C1_9BACT|nr:MULTISPECIES: pyruvate kinase [Dyadobacter]MBZ1362988.1 pyruvate kinase [Dyadobacter fermentans]MDR6807551.1 pyruvate kinase [Dyadobacter fermentans]MDR7045292.1 pyruvate kinase [Dyadobacter sp. BE242]MDR7199605.1 pyruvate kinase [Dyadobacter sp. BE34]MDR7217936.1 pyruvate kinase [Dyadobacter sp. BE31]
MSSKKTRIVATVGPTSESKETLYALAKAGVNVFRLNFSHGSHADHLQRLTNIREINEEHGLNLAILQDLQGPKIRIGLVAEKDGVLIEPGKKLILSNTEVLGTAEKVSTPYDGMYNDVKIGDRVLMDDGKLEVLVTGIEGTDVITEVIYGGYLKSKKGVNLPNTRVSMPSVTPKDYEDLDFGLENNVEWIALSFVRTAEEITKVKEYIANKGKQARVVAKIEKPEAILNIDEIIEATDAIMVARGDLGVELPAEEVPMIQKMIVEKCNRAGKPVIVATQMLESMIESPRATRAELNDVANSVLDGADAVMLSAETASGKYPILAVESMSRTIEKVEANSNAIYFRHHAAVNDSPGAYKLNDNVVMSACRLARDTQAAAIIGITRSGYTSFRLSHHRPKANLLIFTSNRMLMNQLALYWGTKVFYYDRDQGVSTDDLIEDIKTFLVEKGELQKGDVFINTLSMPVSRQRKTNTVKLSVVE